VSELERLSHHEAAHALVATLAGIPIGICGLYPPQTTIREDALAAASPYDLACVASAGVIIDNHFGVEVATHEKSDAFWAAEETLKLVDAADPADTDVQYMALIRGRTAEVLNRNWGAVELIAGELVNALASGDALSAQQVKSLIQQARASGPKRERPWQMAKAPARQPDWASIFAELSARATGVTGWWMPEPGSGKLEIGDSVQTQAGLRHVIGKRAGLVKLRV
jgi:hypothetical protein